MIPLSKVNFSIEGDVPIYLKLAIQVTHPMKIQLFRHCQASHTKANKPRSTKFCQMLEGLRGLQSTVKILGKFVTKKFAPAYVKYLTTSFRKFLTRHRITPEQYITSTNQYASVNLQCVP